MANFGIYAYPLQRIKYYQKGDKMDKALNRKLSRIVSALLCIALALGVFTAVGSSVLFARADDDDTGYTPFVMEEMTLSNNQFSSSTGSFPKTPDSWTSAGVAGWGCGGGGGRGGGF